MKQMLRGLDDSVGSWSDLHLNISDFLRPLQNNFVSARFFFGTNRGFCKLTLFDLLVHTIPKLAVLKTKKNKTNKCKETKSLLPGEAVEHNSKLNPHGGVSTGGDVCWPSSDHDMFIPGKSSSVWFPDLTNLNSPTAFISERKDWNNLFFFHDIFIMIICQFQYKSMQWKCFWSNCFTAHSTCCLKKIQKHHVEYCISVDIYMYVKSSDT